MTKLLLMLMMVSVWSGCGKNLMVWKEHYPKDEVKEEYQYYPHLENKRRIKDGWYKSYYPNGRYREVGIYKDNERQGEWTHYSKDGKETKGIYINGKKDSGEFWVHFAWDYDIGWIIMEDETADPGVDAVGNIRDIYKGLLSFEDGLFDGFGVIYHENGNKLSEGFYSDGLRNGSFKIYHRSEALSDSGQYVDDKREGQWVRYYETGSVESEIDFFNGKHHGNLIRYYENGKVSLKGTMAKGWRNGYWVSYYESGMIKGEGLYEKGKEAGKHVEYGGNGDITDEDIWKDGVCAEMCEGDE